MHDLTVGLVAGGVVSGPIFLAAAYLDTRAATRQEVLENVRFVRERASDPVGFKPFADLNLRNAPLRGLSLGCVEPQSPDAPTRCSDFTSADLRAASFSDADLSGATLRNVKAHEGDFTTARLEGADLRSADLTDALISGADFTGADLRRASLDGAVGVPLTALGEDPPDVNHITTFAGANLEGASLTVAKLNAVAMSGAKLVRADLTGAQLSGADLTGADLTSANLKEAYVARALLAGTNLTGANLDGATIFSICYDQSTRWPKGFAPSDPPDCPPTS